MNRNREHLGLGQPQPFRGVIVYGLSGIFLIIIIVLFIIPQTNATARHNNALLTLSEIGNAQFAHQGYDAQDIQTDEFLATNPDATFVSLDILIENEYFSDNSTLENLIPGYSIKWEVSNPETSDFGAPDNSSFTIIAYPINPKFPFQQPLAICDDYVIRVYKPENGNIEDSVETWDTVE